MFDESRFRVFVDEVVRKAIAEAFAEHQAKYLTIQEAARLVSVDRRTIERMLDSGQLREYRVNSRRRVNRVELERLVATPARTPEDSTPEQAARLYAVKLRKVG